MKKVVRMCPFMGLDWEDENGELHQGGEGLLEEEKDRLGKYFGKFNHMPFSNDRAVELAQMALDDVDLPEDWKPKL